MGRPAIDHTGETFGNIEVLGYAEVRGKSQRVLARNNRTGDLKVYWYEALRSGSITGIGSGNKLNAVQRKYLQSNNTSGYPGVSRLRTGKWGAYIKINKKRIWLGTFNTKDEAIAARKAAEHKYLGGN